MVGGIFEIMIDHGSVLVILGIVMTIKREVLNVRPKLHEPLLSLGARATQQQFQAPTLMTMQQPMDIQSTPLMELQQQMDIYSVHPMALQQQTYI